MHPSDSSASDGPVTAVVVLHDSAGVVEACLRSILSAAPRRGVEVVVVDNASRDDGPRRAASIVGEDRVVRRETNDGFAAGVNAGIARARTPWIAVLNPDTTCPTGTLDALADVLLAHPAAGLAAPRVVREDGSAEPTVGLFPTLDRERAHTWMLDRLFGAEGRRGRFPERTAPVDWVSGCAWMLRADAARLVGALDEAYFMYYEDVDYCRRLTDAGWQVLATPEVRIVHAIGEGSTATPRVPADGGAALVRYFAKFDPGVPEDRVRALLLAGWRLRMAWRRLRAALGHAASGRVAERYRLAIQSLERT